MNLTTINFILYKSHLTDLFTFLQQQNINFLVLKGWAFIPDLYPDPSSRPFGDVDILIHPQDYQIATSCMAELGYINQVGSNPLVRSGSKPAHPSTNPLVRLGSNPLVRAGSQPAHPNPQSSPGHIPLEITFSHPAGVHIDLHTHLLTLAWWQTAFPLDLNHVWHTSQPYQDSTGLELQRLSPEVTFLHLCLHLFNHGIFNPRFHSYLDLVLLLRKYGTSMQWDQVLQLATDWHLQNIVLWVSQVLQRDYKTTLPIKLSPKSSPHYKYIHSQFSQSSILNPQSSTLNSKPWFSSFLLRLALIDHPTILPKLLWNAIFPTQPLRTAIHNRPCTLLQHWQTYTRRLLKS